MTPTKTAPAKNYEAGFTLLELLVALSLAAILFTLLSGGIRFSTAAWKSLDSYSQSNRNFQIAQSAIRRLVKKALPLSVKNTDHIDFEGSGDHIQFVVSNIARLDEPGLFRVRLGRKPDDSRDGFVVGWKRYSYQEEASSKYESQQLLPDVQSIKFRYFGGSAENPDRKSWHDSWKAKSILPDLVSIKVMFSGDGPQAWPDQYIAIETSPR